MDMKQRKQMKPRRDIVEMAERKVDIYRRWTAGETMVSIAASYGVSSTNIHQHRNFMVRKIKWWSLRGVSEEDVLQAMVDEARERYRAHYGED